MIDTEKLIKELMVNKPTFDGEDTNYDVVTIENAINVVEKYSEIKKIVEEFYRKTTKEKPIETSVELRMYLKEYDAHELCLANQLLDIFSEVD